MEQTAKVNEKLVEIVVNNQAVSVPKETTGAEIKELAGLAPDFQLFVIRGDHEDEIENDEEIHVHKGEAFSATPTLDPS